LQAPPNHRLFTPSSTPRISPVLQCCLDTQNAKTLAQAVSTAPVFNFSIGKDIVELFRPPVPAAALPLTPSTPAVAAVISTHPPTYDLQCPTLLQPSRLPGEDMPLPQFCAQYKLGTGILDKLLEHSYSQARTLRFLTVEDLKEMKFRLGEIAALREVIDVWSVPIS
jgi:hypothetical protein